MADHSEDSSDEFDCADFSGPCAASDTPDTSDDEDVEPNFRFLDILVHDSRLSEKEHEEISKMTFSSEEDAYSFFNNYAKGKGFSIRRGHTKKKENGTLFYRQFYCSRAGLRERKYLFLSSRKRRARALTRVACPVKISIILDWSTGEWRVGKFVNTHNHVLARPDQVCFLRSHRKIQEVTKAKILSLQLAGLRKHQIMDALEQESCGYQDVGMTAKDLYNFSHRVKSLRQKIQSAELSDKFGLGLTKEEILAVELVEQIEQTVVIVKMGGDNSIRLTGEWMKSLVQPPPSPPNIDGQGRWLMDEVIDAYINIINHRKDPSRRVLTLNTFNTRLLQEDKKKTSVRTTKNIRDLGANILKSDLVFFPINLHGFHWIAGALDMTRKEFQILDSIQRDKPVDGNLYESLTFELRLGIQRCINIALDTNQSMSSMCNEVDITGWKVTVIETTPEQTDLSSCGLFTLRCIELWDGSKFSSKFDQSGIELFRKKIVAELIMSELNIMKVVPQEIKKLLTQLKFI